MSPTRQHAVREAADRLAAATQTGEPCTPIRDLIGPADLESAYEIQSRNITSLVEAGHRIVGRKIGLTSPAVQEQLGVDTPDFGALLDDMDCSHDAEIDLGRLIQPRIEAEIAFILSREINEPISFIEATDYVSDLYAAFEIVDSRISDWDISLADTVADNASSGLYVLGSRLARADAPDLAEIKMAMFKNATLVSQGKGSDCLGSPWRSLAWLANSALKYGFSLQKGGVVLSGALGPMVPVTRGDTYTATISGIGSVTASFGI